MAAGRIFDLRKRGLVPLAGKLQGPGVVHDMAVRLQLEYPSLRIRAIEPSMSAFPFAPGPATRGESCRDRLPDVQRLVGASLRDGYGPTVMEQVGGPRGCFHIFTLLRLSARRSSGWWRASRRAARAAAYHRPAARCLRAA